MPIETLEEIRLLTNLETKQDKLLQIVLFGQPELDENLNQNKIRQLRERITHSFYLSPFDKADIEPYIEYRLRKAGYAGPPLFTADALKLLSRASEGLVRRANILADKALLSTFSENTYQVGRKNVLAAIKDSEFSREMGKSHKIKKWLIAFAILLILVGLIGVMLTAWQNNQLAIKQFFNDLKHQALPSSKTKTETKPDTQAKPNTSTVNTPPQANASTTSTGGYDPKEDLTLPATTESTTAKTAPSSEAVNSQINATTTKPTEVKPTDVKPVEAKPVEAKPAEANAPNTNIAAPVGNNASAEQTPANTAPTITQPVLSDALMAKINASKIWFNEQSASTVTIQLMGLPATQVESQLNVVAKHLDIENIHVYQKVVKGQPYVTLVYGTYASKAEAISAIETLPTFIQSNSPYIRTIGGILKETKHLQ
jgi:MSHA biogenesis protein MshM